MVMTNMTLKDIQALEPYVEGLGPGQKLMQLFRFTLLGHNNVFWFTSITTATDSSPIFSELIILKLFCCKQGYLIPCVFELIWSTISEHGNIMFRIRKRSCVPYYCWAMYCHCEFILQSRAVALKIKPLRTWIEPKFFCSKKLDKRSTRKQLHIWTNLPVIKWAESTVYE